MRRSILALLLAASPASAQDVKPDAAAALAAEVRPHPRQVAWQALGFTCFVHFGVNTFTGREWGTGLEDPALFQPARFDADQWCAVAREAGMRLVMLTAKHHDGFCLFPSDYTDHDVAASPWRGGAGDVVGDLAQACGRQGLELGLYLSPADLAEIERPGGRYGNGSAARPSVIPTPVPGRPAPTVTRTYVVDDYNRYFLDQLHEVLTRYGPVREVWFDGANPKPGTGQTYAYEAWYDLIRALQPEAVIAIKGPDVRWCGNEAGHVREQEWSVVAIPDLEGGARYPDLQAGDLGSRARLAADLNAGRRLHWWPSEVNTSIRHGWFWRDESQHVKSADELLDVWYGAVGGNAVFLLNVPPNREGRFADRDAAVLRELGRRLRATFGTDLAEGGALTRSGSTWELRLPVPRRFNRVELREDVAGFGQRVEGAVLEAEVDGKWRALADARFVGFRRILKVAETEATALRLRVTASRGEPRLAAFALFHEARPLAAPRAVRDSGGALRLVCDPPAPMLRYTLDGSAVSSRSRRYDGPLPFAEGGRVRARAFDADGAAGPELDVTLDLAPLGWRVHAVSSEQAPVEAASKAIDGDPDTLWHTRWQGAPATHPHWVVIDLGRELELHGVTYLPRQGSPNGTLGRYAVSVSRDRLVWAERIQTGEFGNVLANPVTQHVRFEEPVRARFVKLIALSSAAGDPWASAAEIGVLTR